MLLTIKFFNVVMCLSQKFKMSDFQMSNAFFNVPLNRKYFGVKCAYNSTLRN